MTYRILTCRPGESEEVLSFLLSSGAQPIHPRATIIVRRGRERIKTSIDISVLPGLFLIPEEDVELVPSRGVRWMLTPTGYYATCTEIQVQEFVCRIEDFIKIPSRSKPGIVKPTSNTPQPTGPLQKGDRVQITQGPLTGITATVTKDSGKEAVILLDKVQVPTTVPSCFLQRLEVL